MFQLPKVGLGLLGFCGALSPVLFSPLPLPMIFFFFKEKGKKEERAKKGVFMESKGVG